MGQLRVSIMANQADREAASNNQAANELNAEEQLLPDLTETEEEVEITFEGTSDRDTGKSRTVGELTTRMASGADTTKDIDANLYQAKVTGEEAVGGLTPTPEQNVSENLQEAAGIESAEKEPVQTSEELERRDENRWELEPKSSEDYQNRRD